jgi:hypothetical protein
MGLHGLIARCTLRLASRSGRSLDGEDCLRKATPEFTSNAILAWCTDTAIISQFIAPGKPIHGDLIASFNNWMRYEFLNETLFFGRRIHVVLRREGYSSPCSKSRSWSHGEAVDQGVDRDVVLAKLHRGRFHQAEDSPFAGE